MSVVVYHLPVIKLHLRAFVLTVLLAVFPLCSAAAPNIVVIMVDDLNKNAFEVLTQGGWMPNLKSRILDKGVSFQNSFVTNSQCCPSRATFLTGQYSHNHGVYSNIGNHPLKTGITWPGWLPAGDLPGKNSSTIATWLSDAGYHTGYTGKYLNGYGASAPEFVTDPQTYIPPGWAEWNGLIDPTTYRVYDYLINQNGVVTSYGSLETDYQTDVLANISIDFIKRAAVNAQPFFLLVTPLAPHLEVQNPIDFLTGNEPRDGLGLTIRPAKRHAYLIDGLLENNELPELVIKPSFYEADISDKPSCPRPLPPVEVAVSFEPHCVADAAVLRNAQDKANLNKQYKSMLASMLAVDDMIGGIIAELERNNLLSNTVLIFTSDNGWLYGEHRMIGKELAYEESIRVPLVISAPGGQTAVQSSRVVLNNDLAPSIAAFAGVVPPYETDGVSLLSLLQNPEDSNWHRKFFLVERWFLPSLFKFESPTSFAIRRIDAQQDYIYISSNANPSEPAIQTDNEFYELNSDPYQLQSLLLPDSVRRLFDNLLLYFRRCQGAQCTALESL